jgi:photosystem II stability/assembly factor-like uncharacterized protein
MWRAGFAMLLLIAGHAGVATASAWKSIGPYGGTFVDLVEAPGDAGTLYTATTEGQVFRTTDGGRLWRPVSILDVPVTGLAIGSGGTVYVGTVRGLVKSTDGGASWEAAGFDGIRVNSVAADPFEADKVFAAVSGAGASGGYVSRDAGATWNAISPQLILRPLHFFFDPTHTSTVWAAYGGRVVPGNGTCRYFWNGLLLRSDDGGRTWNPSESGIEYPYVPAQPNPYDPFYGCDAYYTGAVQSLAFDPYQPGMVLAIGSATGHHLYRSTDGGAQWTPVLDVIHPSTSVVVFSPVAAGLAYALSGWDRATHAVSLLRSADGGATFEAVALPPGAETADAVLPSRFDSETVYLVGRGAGSGAGNDETVWRSGDRGATWEFASTGLAGIDVPSFAVDPSAPSTLYAGAFRSVDGGGTWSRMDLPGFQQLVYGPASPAPLYAATLGGVFSSADHGATWVRLGSLAGALDLTVRPGSPDYLLALGLSGGLVPSIDGGASWDEQFDPTGPIGFPFFDGPLNDVVFAPGAAVEFFLATESGAFLYRSEDARRWAEAGAGLAGPVRVLLADPTAPGTLYAGAKRGVFVTTDSAASWSPVGDTSEEVRALALDPRVPGVVFAGTESGRVLKSIAGGAWRALGPGLPGFPVRSLAVGPAAPSRIYAGLPGGSAWLFDQCGDGVVDPGESAVDEVACIVAAVDEAGLCGGRRLPAGFRRAARRRLAKVARLVRRAGRHPRRGRAYARHAARSVARLLRAARRLPRKAKRACLAAIRDELGGLRKAIGAVRP